MENLEEKREEDQTLEEISSAMREEALAGLKQKLQEAKEFSTRTIDLGELKAVDKLIKDIELEIAKVEGTYLKVEKEE